jgi:hypothetical protein
VSYESTGAGIFGGYFVLFVVELSYYAAFALGGSSYFGGQFSSILGSHFIITC